MTDRFFSDSITKYLKSLKEKKDPDADLKDLHGCSREYFDIALTKPLNEFGFPRTSFGLGSGHFDSDMNYDVFDSVRKINDKIKMFLGTPNSALTMLYPDDGYIGWHHNGNAPGYNILLTYSQDGNGCFQYYDYDRREIITLKDRIGWSAKVGYYPSVRNEPEKAFWHCAKTEKARITLAYVIDHRDMWKNLIHEITSGKID